jgi:hypothetical protein
MPWLNPPDWEAAEANPRTEATLNVGAYRLRQFVPQFVPQCLRSRPSHYREAACRRAPANGLIVIVDERTNSHRILRPYCIAELTNVACTIRQLRWAPDVVAAARTCLADTSHTNSVEHQLCQIVHIESDRKMDRKCNGGTDINIRNDTSHQDRSAT